MRLCKMACFFFFAFQWVFALFLCVSVRFIIPIWAFKKRHNTMMNFSDFPRHVIIIRVDFRKSETEGMGEGLQGDLPGMPSRRPLTYQGKTPWVDSARAECPGFLVPGPVLLVPRLPAALCHWASICFMGPWRFAWICCPHIPYHLLQKRDAQHMFLQHKGAHTEHNRMDLQVRCDWPTDR